MSIDLAERVIRGRWQLINGKVVEDAECHRIRKLVSSYLIPIGRSQDGWEKLFRDPLDGRYWELTYPQSELHGGGPPELRNISEFDAKLRYLFS